MYYLIMVLLGTMLFLSIVLPAFDGCAIYHRVCYASSFRIMNATRCDIKIRCVIYQIISTLILVLKYAYT